MKPIVQIASAKTPEGRELVLSRHDRDFFIMLERRQLMSSREHESELALARLGCERIRDRRAPTVLIGGLGLGYTLRQALDMLQPQATVVVAELVPEVVRWNREHVGELTGHPLRDKRVIVKTEDVGKILRASHAAFDAILLDVDNGPFVTTSYSRTGRLYSREGIRATMRALHRRGCLAVWAANLDPAFGKFIERQRLHVRRFRAAAYKGAKRRTRCIWMVAQDPRSLPARADSNDVPPAEPAAGMPVRPGVAAGGSAGPPPKSEPLALGG